MSPKHPIKCGKCRATYIKLSETVAYSHHHTQFSDGRLSRKVEASSDYEEIIGVFATCLECGCYWKTRMSGIHEHPDWSE